MDRVKFGKSDLEVSRLCLGTWNMGGDEGWGPDDDEQSIELIRRVQDSGCNFMDSAHGYGGGHSEEVLGRALAEGGRRERAVVSTKIVQCDPERVEPSLDASLERLQSDYWDIYIVHWPRPSLSLETFLEKMCEMRDKGKARHIGVSNFNLEQLRIAAEYGCISLQPPYNVLWRIIEPEVVPFCREHDIAVTPYSPLAQGLLTGRFSRASEPPTGIRTSNLLFKEPTFTKARAAAAVVDAVADKLGRTSSQIALAWLLKTDPLIFPIVGVSKWSHWEDNAGALDVDLSDADYEAISQAGLACWSEFNADDTMWGWKPE